MARTLLLVVLAIAVLPELGLTGGVFWAPVFTLAQFWVKYGPETAFLAYLLGWFLLLTTVSVWAALARVRVQRQRPGHAGRCYELGPW